ncbi:MAG TPA: lytic transglycosylase domain-containing protein [Blastocatellia bacterium]|nr:lytic transglycosylase domain-containing protein [Blastocatellia bacterium]
MRIFVAPVGMALFLALLVAAPREARAQDNAGLAKIEADNTAGGDYDHVPAMVVQEAVRAASQGEIVAPNKLANKYSAKPIVLSGTPAERASLGQSTGNAGYDKMVVESAARNGVDPNLILAVMNQESGNNPHARSYKGACGLMQLMPATARRFGITNIFDPAQNIEGGARYLRFLLDKFNDDVSLALAGYNAGEGAVVDAGYQIPRFRETRNYVKSISARYGAGAGAAKSAGVSAASPAMVVGGGSGCLSNNY